jgi:hypothetical protein
MAAPPGPPLDAGDRRRWDVDERFTGVADASPAVPALEALLAACRTPGWVTEDADAHLGGHLRAECERDGAPFRWLGATQGADGVLDVEVATSLRRNDAFRAAVALLAVVAESAFAVRRAGPWVVECVTGMLAGDGEFATHGHTVRLTLRPEGDLPE